YIARVLSTANSYTDHT
ncbi:hypothetical protein, partial [Frankia torreyi]